MIPTISIIMPIYNAGKYIAESLDSACTQTIDNIEIICVDDCSTDNSVEVINSYNDDRIHLFTMDKNSGAGPARNRGIAEAKGEFIAFLDPDDLFADTTCLERLYDAAKLNNVIICGGNLDEFYNDNPIDATEWGRATFIKDSKVSYADYPYSIGYYRFIYNRKMIVDNGLEFPNLRRYQDPVWFVQVMSHAKEFYGMNMPVYLYRKNHQRVHFTPEKIDHVLKGMTQNLQIFRDQHLKTHYGHEETELKNFVYKMVYRYPKISTYRVIKKYDIDFKLNDVISFLKIGVILLKNKISFYYNKIK